MKKTKFYAMVGWALLIVLLLAGCGPALTPAAESPDAVEAPAATLTPVTASEVEEAPPEPATAATDIPPLPTPLPTQTPNLVNVDYEMFAPNTIGPDIEQFPEDVNPTTGLKVKDPTMLDLPAVMVSITNYPPSARPQAGLSDAPHVYEIYIGEGMTRFLAVFYGSQPEEEPMTTGNFPVRQGPFVRTGLILGNQVWFDENDNGIQDPGEWGIGGVGVSLLDGENGRMLDTTTTDSNGFYGFNVFPGHSYALQFLLPGGFYFSPQHAGNDRSRDSDADPETGLTPVVTTYFDDFNMDVGLVLVNAYRHLPEGDSEDQPQEDYAAEGEAFLSQLLAGDVDTSQPGSYLQLRSILSGLSEEGDAPAGGLNLAQPSGANSALMQSLLDVWNQSVAAQQEAIQSRAGELADGLHLGNLDLLGDARVMMMVLGGVDSSAEKEGEFGPLRILPQGSHQAQMQALIDTTRSGAALRATALTESLRSGSLDAMGEAVQMMLFLRERSYLREEDLGGILGVLPLGENAKSMQELAYATREGAQVRADDLIARLSSGEDLQAVREARMLLMMLAENPDPALDERGLPLAEGPNAELMEELLDAIYSMPAEAQAALPLLNKGASALMSPLPVQGGEEDPENCVTRVSLPGAIVTISWEDASNAITIPQTVDLRLEGGQAVVNLADGSELRFQVPAGTEISMDQILLPPGAQVLQEAGGVLYISDPGCEGSFQPHPYLTGWGLIGPTRSGRIYMSQFTRFYTGGCVVYAHKDPTVPISGCQIVIENYDPDDINGSGFNPENLRAVADANRPFPGFIPNYSGNSFLGNNPWQPGATWSSLVSDAGAQELPGVLASPQQLTASKKADSILMFYSNLNQTFWEYDPLIGAYLRFEDFADPNRPGEFTPSLDRFTGRQLYFSNVVVLFTHHDVVRANVINVEMEGSRGNGIVFRNGQAFDVIWTTLNTEYEYETEMMRPVRIEDKDGNPFPLAQGQTWFHLVTLTSETWEVEPGMWKVRSYDPPGAY